MELKGVKIKEKYHHKIIVLNGKPTNGISLQ
jgi:hypothetical protein